MTLDELRRILERSVRVARTQGLSAFSMLVLEKISKREFRVIGPSVPDDEYANWIAKNEFLQCDLDAQRTRALKFSYRPLIGVIMPVWNPPIQYLTEALESVLSQTYDNWELCVTDGGSNEMTKNLLREFSQRNEHVFVRFLERNLGISENSNTAMQLSHGEFIAFLDHDDLLAPNALFEVVDLLNRTSQVDVIYSDSDRLTVEGNRTDPLFKPDWSPDMMLSTNYLAHLRVIRSTLMKELGGFRSETDGAQDWDLFLRATERARGICHIPKILYHWREAPASVSSGGGFFAKPYLRKAHLLVVDEYLKRHHIPARARFHKSDCLQLKWDLSDSPLISIILFTSNNFQFVNNCAHSIRRKSTYRNFEILCVCNDDSHDKLENVRMIRTNGPAEYSSANNLGAFHAKGEVLIFLDERLEVLSPDWLQELAGWALLPGVGAVGAKILFTDRKIFHGGIIFELPGYLFQGVREGSRSPVGYTEWYRNFMAVSGGCLATRSEVFNKLGGFSRQIGGIADLAFCLRATLANYRIVYAPHVRLILRESRGTEFDASCLRNVAEFKATFAQSDPYYNPNLSYDSTVPKLRENRKEPQHVP